MQNEKYWFHDENINFFAEFHFLRLFLTKKHDLTDHFFRLSRAVAVAVRIHFYHAYSIPLKSFKAEILAPGVFKANLISSILRILIFLRVPSLQISTKNKVQDPFVLFSKFRRKTNLMAFF
jgi:hypothetical protein